MAKKVFRISLPKIRTLIKGATETRTLWPKGWRAELANVVAYEETIGNETGNLNKGAIVIVDEANWAFFKDLPGVAEISDAEANLLGQQWRPQVVKVDTDKAIITLAELIQKYVHGISPEDLKALDPKDETPGINLSPAFDIKALKGEPK